MYTCWWNWPSSWISQTCPKSWHELFENETNLRGKKSLPFSISWGCPQSISIQVGGQADHDPDERHSMSAMPFRLNPKSHLKVARPPILRVVRIMVPLDGVVMFLQRVSLQVGASGSHFPLVSQRRRSNPEIILKNETKMKIFS